MAVLGIITFYNPVYKLLLFKNVIIDKIWSVIAVSFAAQLGTFPIAAHYFHSFPTWFLLTNLIVFPFSFLIITGGLIFIVVSWIPIVSTWTGTLLSGMIYLMNWLVNKVSQLPGSNIDSLYFPIIKIIIVYSIIFSLFKIIFKQKIKLILFSLFTILLFIITETIHRYDILTQKKVVIYDFDKKGNAIDFIFGNSHLLLADTILTILKTDIRYATENSRIKWGLTENTLSFYNAASKKNNIVNIANNFMSFESLRILKSEEKIFKTNNKLDIDWLWITENTQQSIESLCETLNFRKVVIGSTVYNKKALKIKKFLKTKGIPYHDINEQGCLIEEFK
jgi:competence protein ComEC